MSAGRAGRATSVARVAWLAARLVAATAAGFRLTRAARRVPAVRTDPVPFTGATVSVVVPARDEAGRIGRLLDALAAEPTPHELVVVDDESTDATAVTAAAGGARVLAGAPLPPGWVGKPWALHQGLGAVSGEWVVTLDADTVPRPGLLAALVRRAEADGWDLLSVGGRIECPDALQAALHPSMLTTLVYRFGPPGSGRIGPADRTVANGQCTVFRREALLAVGGYAPVAGHLTDDVALARHLAGAGWRVGFLDATEAMDVGMYPSASAAWRDWGRSLPMVDVTSLPWLVADLAVVWLAQALPLVRLVIGRGDVVDLALLALRLATLVGTRRAYRAPGTAYWLSPLLDVPVAARLTQAAVRPERSWRGRTYAPAGRAAGWATGRGGQVA